MKKLLSLLSVLCLMACQQTQETTFESQTPVDYVSTLVGTHSKYTLSTGNTYPAIALPWGMNFWTPQTGKMGDGWAYVYDADKILSVIVRGAANSAFCSTHSEARQDGLVLTVQHVELATTVEPALVIFVQTLEGVFG